jgi:hypothetical protein
VARRWCATWRGPARRRRNVEWPARRRRNVEWSLCAARRRLLCAPRTRSRSAARRAAALRGLEAGSEVA